MKTAILKYPSREAGAMHRTIPGLLAAVLLASLAMTAGAEDDFQRNALFNPTQAQLQEEARGRVVIYDRLENEVVDRAMDEQFGRIEHMMFIRIRRTQPDGKVGVEDDDC